MKVLVETTAHPGGGSLTYLNNLLEQFADTDDRYTIVVPPERDALTDQDAPNIEFVETSFPVGNAALREVYRQIVLPLVLLRSDIDLLFSTGDVTSLFSPVPTVVIVHNLAPYARSFGLEVGRWRRIRNAIHRTMTRLSVRRAARIVWVSRFMAETVGGLFDVSEEKGTVIHHGVDPGKFTSPTEPEDPTLRSVVATAEPYLLTVSTVNPHKNYETLIEGLARLPEAHRERYDLLLAGRHPNEAYFEQLQQHIEEAGLEDSIRFLGSVSHEVLPYLYAQATAYVFPSRLESFGLTPLEAMVTRTPVVASDATSIPEICGDAPEYFDPENPDDLARALDHVLSNPERRRSLVEAGENRVRSFNWNETAIQTEALLRQTVEGERRGE